MSITVATKIALSNFPSRCELFSDFQISRIKNIQTKYLISFSGCPTRLLSYQSKGQIGIIN